MKDQIEERSSQLLRNLPSCANDLENLNMLVTKGKIIRKANSSYARKYF